MQCEKRIRGNQYNEYRFNHLFRLNILRHMFTAGKTKALYNNVFMTRTFISSIGPHIPCINVIAQKVQFSLYTVWFCPISVNNGYIQFGVMYAEPFLFQSFKNAITIL